MAFVLGVLGLYLIVTYCSQNNITLIGMFTMDSEDGRTGRVCPVNCCLTNVSACI